MSASIKHTGPVDPAAINFIRRLRRVAIGRCCDAEGEPGIAEATTDHGNLTCTATPGITSADGAQIYRARFSLNDKPISLDDAERLVMGAIPKQIVTFSD